MIRFYADIERVEGEPTQLDPASTYTDIRCSRNEAFHKRAAATEFIERRLASEYGGEWRVTKLRTSALGGAAMTRPDSQDAWAALAGERAADAEVERQRREHEAGRVRKQAEKMARRRGGDPCGRVIRRMSGADTTCVLPAGHVAPREHRDETGYTITEELAAHRDRVVESGGRPS